MNQQDRTKKQLFEEIAALEMRVRELENADTVRRQQVEETLTKSQSLIQAITDSAQDAILMMDPEGCISFWNPAAEHIFGYTVPEAMGRNLHQFLAPSRFLEAYLMGVARFKYTGQGDALDKTLELQACRKNGEEFPIELSLSAIRLQDGWHAVGIIRDIAERKQAEAERRTLEERLHRSEKMEALGTMAGGVAHDLNNVLGIVVGYAQMLLLGHGKNSDIAPLINNIMHGGQRAAAIVDDLLTLARRGVQMRQVLSLNKIIGETQQSPQLGKLHTAHPDIKISLNLEPNLLNIAGSAIHLSKALFNLVSNAIEAMAEGGSLTIRTANIYLDKPVGGYDEVRSGDYVVLSVSDTGEGIPEKDQKHIFEPFYTKKIMGRKSGTGLGLAVVWGTVKDHNGYIDVQSKPGIGSTFTLYFPITREEIAPEDATVEMEAYMGNGKSILVVDDVKEQRELAAGMLETLNYNVFSVASGEEAVVWIKDHHVDLVVLDMIMDPGIDGLDTYREILTVKPDQRAVIVSGFSESDRVRNAQSLGAGPYVKKPYVIEKLGGAVKEALSQQTSYLPDRPY